MVIAQIDSELYHGSQLDKANDEAQRARLEGAGYVVERVLEYQVWHQPGPMLAPSSTTQPGPM